MISLAEAEALDARDPLRPMRDQFRLPEGVIYLDGNSLGPLPEASVALARDVVERQWGESLIRSWNDHDWIGAPQRIGAKIAALIGAHPHEVIVADSTSVNLFKLLVAALRLTPERPKIVSETGNFPTDLYMSGGAAGLTPGASVDAVETAALDDALDDRTGVMLLTHVHYKSGYRHDMAAMTARASAAGVRTLWDLSHSVGAVDLNMARDGAELAVGCGYKYLNGGPGAPAFLYIATHLQEALQSPLTGWMGHAAPFAFVDDYMPGQGINRFLCGTPPVLSLLALEGGVDLFLKADHAAVWAKSSAMFDLFAALMAERCPEFACITPADPARRGSHISYAHDAAWPICQTLIAKGVIGDYRAPEVLRFGLTPLYLGFADIWRAVDILAGIMASGEWRDPRYAAVAKVT